MYQNILLTIDLDQAESWVKALPIALGHAQAFGTKLHVMTVIPPFGMSIVGQFFPGDYEHKVQEAALLSLKEWVLAHVPSEIKVQHIVSQGTVYEEIIETANKIDADLIVMAAHGPRLGDYLLGPNAARVARHSTKSVLVVR